MADEELQVVTLNEGFYKDSFRKVVGLIISIAIAILSLIGLSLYLHFNKPPPMVFSVGDEWRIKPPVPVDQPYLTIPDLLQWVSMAVRKIFVFDFIHYNVQLKSAMQYFTDDGWKIFLNQLNIYANANDIQTNKQFVFSKVTSAPYILRQGKLPTGKYAWWVQIPITLSYYSSYNRFNTQNITLQLLVVRVPTLNNLDGVAIDNVIINKNTGNQL